jgi:hypothetical protein
MEALNMRSQWESRECTSRGLVGGLILLTLGTVFLLTNLGVLHFAVVRTWWPLVLIVIGIGWLFVGRGLRRPYNDFGPV